MLIHKNDNVYINLENGHKYALYDIKKGEKIIKYGECIGISVEDIAKDSKVHTHNMKTLLSDNIDYKYEPDFKDPDLYDKDLYFMGYRRENGDIGIRNDIWIVNTVVCVNKVSERLSALTGALSFPHPCGCSQLGDDLSVTQKILAAMVNHPNAAGVLVLGLGCENNHIGEFKKVLGDYDERRVKFLNTQDCEDEIEEGVRLINELKEYALTFKREKFDISRLRIGLKCGGSDGYSGITANPLVGRISDIVVSKGGCAVLTEVPEMFGAEHLLMNRCESSEIFDKTVSLINNFKDYFRSYGEPIYENPSPGNKEGGITTLEEKSLGCIQKGGTSRIKDVLDYGDSVKDGGLYLLNGPGNDAVAITNLMAAGVHMILFTTGRGTPLGSAVPTVKISTNRALYEKKKAWIDFDSSMVLDGNPLTEELLSYILEVASGKMTKNEEYGYREIAIFKNGVTL